MAKVTKADIARINRRLAFAKANQRHAKINQDAYLEDVTFLLNVVTELRQQLAATKA